MEDHTTPQLTPEEELWWRAGMMVALMRIYDLILMQIHLEHGEDVARQILRTHDRGKYIFPAPDMDAPPPPEPSV